MLKSLSGKFTCKTTPLLNIFKRSRSTQCQPISSSDRSSSVSIVNIDWTKQNQGVPNMSKKLIYHSYRHPNRPISKGPVQGVILDWSGTTADAYVDSVKDGMIQTFGAFGIEINNLQARKPMGHHKKLHIAAIGADENVQEQWKNKYGRLLTLEGPNNDLDKLFTYYENLQMKLLEKPNNKYTRLLPGTAWTVDILRKDFKLKIGSTTGFTRRLSAPILKHAAEQGYAPDINIAADEPPRSRPYFDGVLMNALQLGDISDLTNLVKVDDTRSGIQEGRKAGLITVFLAGKGNRMGELSENPEELLSQNPNLYNKYLEETRRYGAESGANFVADDITALPEIIDKINSLLANGKLNPYD